MKKILLIVLVLIVIVTIFVALGYAFPVYKPMLPLLLIVMLIDGYLWLSVRKTIHSFKPFWKYAALFIYWLALGLFILCIIAGVFVSFANWNIPIRTVIPGIIFILIAFKIIPFVFQLIADILRLLQFAITALLHRGTRLKDIVRMKWIQLTGWALGTLFFFILFLGIVWWNYDYNVIRQDIVLPELPASFENLKIVQVSDIHLGSWVCKKELKNAVDLINAQKADVVFFTGDMANYTTRDVLPFEDIITQIKAPYGVFAILGNHDYGAYVKWPSEEMKEQDQKDLFAFYNRLGWRLLLNEHFILKRGNDSIAILGVQNWGKSYRFQKLGDIPATQTGIENVQVQLLLSHDPSFWDTIICHKFRNIDVTFSGHTHGFQFGIECCGIKWSPAQYLYKQWGGLYAKPVPGSHPQYIYVNRGLGSIGYPGRVGILPEITVFTLKSH
jgi:uncharacterized protein